MPHPSLPARPPPPSKTQNGPPSAANGTATRAAPFFTPRSVTTPSQNWQASNPGVAAQPANYAAPQTGYGAGGYGQGAYQGGYQQQQSYQQPGFESAQPTPPAMVNPFPLPGQEPQRDKAAFDPEYQAQLAQWNSAYMSKEDAAKAGGAGRGAGGAGNANAIPLNHNRLTANPPLNDIDLSAASADTGVASVVTGKDGKQSTVIRSGGGKTWQDPSLLEWDPSHFRLFVGNLAGEVTDESLHKAFAKYGSLEKARVVREKRTSKSKGFGFISFSNSDDYFRAFKEMQGKYVGSHPVVLRPSTTEIKSVTAPTNNGKKNNKGRGSNGVLGANTGAGVQKKGQKQKGASMKVLG